MTDAVTITLERVQNKKILHHLVPLRNTIHKILFQNETHHRAVGQDCDRDPPLIHTIHNFNQYQFHHFDRE
ncbi:hypothetical protein ACIPDS_01125 [Kluyvera sp. NPDC087067]|uniref:hypothetical protein n=1 Tax=Kluyvera sp. NPDC087067 TaxID=3364105 RepID=UPI00380363D1